MSVYLASACALGANYKKNNNISINSNFTENSAMFASARAAWRMRVDLRTRLNLKSFVRRKATESEGKKNEISFNVDGQKQTFRVIDVQPEANKYFNSYHTVRGARKVGFVWIGASMLAAVYQLAPHSFGKDAVKAVYENYSRGFLTPVSKQMKSLMNEVAADMGLEGDPSMFVLTLEEPAGWGDSGNELIGYPPYFHFLKPHEVPLDKMRFGGGGFRKAELLTRRQADLPEARLFCDTMVLTTEAKKFALARELKKVGCGPQYYYAFLNASWILLTYNIARHGNQKMGMFKKGMKPLFRLMWYAGLAPTMILSYFLAKDFVSRQIEKTSVSAAAGLGPAYAKGGEEYYNQMLLRNKCIGKFEEPHRRFNLEGELIQGLARTKRVPLLQLRDLCREALTL